MIDLKKYIFESGKEYKIVFNNLSALFLYEAEVSGQISDGYWENARPYNHWQWLWKTETIYDATSENGRSGPHRKEYSLNWMIADLKKGLAGDKDYLWAKRFLKFGKFGAIYPESKWKDLCGNDAVRYVVEWLPEEETTVEDLEKQFSEKDWQKKYWDKAKSIITSDILKKYYAKDYTIKDLSYDLNELGDSLNNTL